MGSGGPLRSWPGPGASVSSLAAARSRAAAGCRGPARLPGEIWPVVRVRRQKARASTSRVLGGRAGAAERPGLGTGRGPASSHSPGHRPPARGRRGGRPLLPAGHPGGRRWLVRVPRDLSSWPYPMSALPEPLVGGLDQLVQRRRRLQREIAVAGQVGRDPRQRLGRGPLFLLRSNEVVGVEPGPGGKRSEPSASARLPCPSWSMSTRSPPTRRQSVPVQ